MRTLSVNDAAELIQVSEQYVRSLVRDGRLSGERHQSGWRIYPDSVFNYIATSKPATDRNSSKPIYASPSCLSFFSGSLGLDLGLEKAGLAPILACEIDPAARRTITTNRPEIALIGDIEAYSARQIRESAGLLTQSVDVVVGGPPCQAFSSAGRRQAFNDERGNVFLRFVDLIVEMQPKVAVIENVRGLLSAALDHIPIAARGAMSGATAKQRPGSALALVLDRLRRGGYGVSFNLYNAANFGSPQKRERFVAICMRDGSESPYLEPTYSEAADHGLPKWRTLRDALSGLGEVQHEFVRFPERRLQYYRMLKAGQNWRDLPAELQKAALGQSYFAGGGKTGFLRRLSWNEPAPTLVTHPAMPATDLCHPDELRPLSIQEYLRIQEFPDNWRLSGGIIDRYKQVGNAVPVSLGKAIGRHVLKLLNNEIIYEIPQFKYSRYKNTSNKNFIFSE